jgi:DNA-binding LacI/PurR family transcriptional regulator
MNDISSCIAHVQSSRPTIALLASELEFYIPVSYLKSATAVAEVTDVNLLYFSSAPVRTPYRFDIQANIFYEMIDKENVDGLLIASNLIGSYISFKELNVFLQRYSPLLMVTMGLAIAGIPGVVLDNFAGVYAVVTHLIEEHGYRKIAYLGGPEDHLEAQERYRAYSRGGGRVVHRRNHRGGKCGAGIVWTRTPVRGGQSAREAVC